MYWKKIVGIALLWGLSMRTISAYTLSNEDAYYVPIMMDDIAIMIALKPVELISPKNGSQINGTLTMKFSKAKDVNKRFLKVYYANHTKQASNTWITSDSYSVTLPRDGKYVDVELYSYIADKYFIKKYRFRQSVDSSYVVSPAQNSRLSSNILTLKWHKGVNVTKQYLCVGTTGYGSQNIYSGWVNGKTSKTLYGLPRDGEYVYIELSSKINGKWYYSHFRYRATDVSVMAKDFVSAYLTNNTSKMRTITTQEEINKLKTKDSTVKTYFRQITRYSKLLYFHDYQALVVATIKNGKKLNFSFSWNGNRWVLDEVI